MRPLSPNWRPACLMLVFGALTSLQDATAHQQAMALTEMTPLLRDTEGAGCPEAMCRVEIAHRLSLHDAEHALLSSFGERPDLLADRAAQRKLEAYVGDRFMLTDGATGERVQLELVGGEVERGYYWVYQEGVLPASVTSVMITNSVLIDTVEGQTNHLNLRLDGGVVSTLFSAGNETQMVNFPER